MGKYIDVAALIDTLNKEKVPFNDDVNYFILNAPAADVAEVRHGRMVIEPDATVMHCNVCGWAYQYYAGLEEEWNYCPNCGSRMDMESEQNG
jgi:acetyl-CoA carboxylase beta subunit